MVKEEVKITNVEGAVRRAPDVASRTPDVASCAPRVRRAPRSAARLLDGSGHNPLMKQVNPTHFC